MIDNSAIIYKQTRFREISVQEEFPRDIGNSNNLITAERRMEEGKGVVHSV